MSHLISVIVPVYNVEPYLARAVDSLLSQTYKNLQIILVDDGSTDNSGKLCDSYAQTDPRITVIHKQNGGLSSARNAGIDQASGAYFAFLDSDDYYSPTMLERLYQVITSNDCAIAQCAYFRFTDTPETQAVTGPVQIQSATDALHRIDDAVYMAAWNKLYKKELFAHIRFPEGKIHEDVGTTYRLFYEGEKIAVIPDALYGYYINPDSITTSKIKLNKLDLLDMYAEQFAFFREKGLHANMRRSADNLTASFGTLLCYDPSRYVNYEEFLLAAQTRYSYMYKAVLRNAPLRRDLKLAVMLSFGNVKVMRLYHKLKQILQRT